MVGDVIGQASACPCLFMFEGLVRQVPANRHPSLEINENDSDNAHASQCSGHGRQPKNEGHS